MSAGLVIYDENGTVVLDAETLVGRIGGTFETGVVNGSYPTPVFAEGTPFYFANLNATAIMQCIPEIAISGSTLTWVFRDYAIPGGNAPRVSATVIFGVT